MEENFQDAEIGVAQLCPLDAPGRVGKERLKGFHENEPEMHTGGVLAVGGPFPFHEYFDLTTNILMSIYFNSSKNKLT
jgi:hypothetical protein